MQIIEYRGIGSAACEDKLCCALGFFDGVHAGHRHLLSECVKEARKRGLKPAAFTFRAEDTVLNKSSQRLYTTAEKAEIFKELGIEVLIIADFESVRELCPENFVRDVLIGELGCRIAMSGEGFRFGKNAIGDTHLLKMLMEKSGCTGIVVPDLKIDGATVSSTKIKEALSKGDVKQANTLLGAPYFIKGRVKHGRGVGHIYGFPTLNTDLPENTVLKGGVYRSEIEIDGKRYVALTNIGTCPTFNLSEIHAETMVLNFEGDLYGEEVKISLTDFIRGERKFDTPEDLKAQIERDVKGLE